MRKLIKHRELEIIFFIVLTSFVTSCIDYYPDYHTHNRNKRNDRESNRTRFEFPDSLLIGEFCGWCNIGDEFENGGDLTIVEKTKDTLTCSLSISLYIPDFYKFDFYISGDSLIIPYQENIYEFPHHTRPLSGIGHYSKANKKLEFKIKSLDTGRNYLINAIKPENVDLTGKYLSSTVENKIVTITKDSDSDSLIVNFQFDYKDKIDSSLANFKIDNCNCSKFIVLQIDEKHSIIGFFEYIDNYITIKFNRCETNGNTTSCKTDYYTFKGYKE